MPVMTEAREDHKLELATEVLRSGGAIRLQALGTSMLPSVWPGDLLSIEPAPGKDMVPGDIVLVARDARFFVHRLIEKDDDRVDYTRRFSAPERSSGCRGAGTGQSFADSSKDWGYRSKTATLGFWPRACLDGVPMGLVPERFPAHSFILEWWRV